MLKIKVYFEVYPGQLAEHVCVASYPFCSEKQPENKRYCATIEVPENDGTDAIPVPPERISVEEI